MLRDGTCEQTSPEPTSCAPAVSAEAARTPPGRHKDRPARSSLYWRMGNAGCSASGRRPRKRGPELKPVGGNPANGKAAARRRKAGASRRMRRCALKRGHWLACAFRRFASLNFPGGHSPAWLFVVVLKLGRCGTARTAAHAINKRMLSRNAQGGRTRGQKVGHAGALLQRHSAVLDHMREQKMPAFAAVPRSLGKVLECALSKDGAGQGTVSRAGPIETPQPSVRAARMATSA